MLDKLSYNQIRLLRLLASILTICLYILNYLIESYFLKILYIIVVLVYLFLVSAVQQKNKKNMINELMIQNKTKTTQIIIVLTIAILFGIILFTNLIGIIFVILVAVYLVKDGYYLYLEGKTCKKNDPENKD